MEQSGNKNQQVTVYIDYTCVAISFMHNVESYKNLVIELYHSYIYIYHSCITFMLLHI